MGILDIVDDADVVELNVEILIDALERSADLDVILELNCDLVVDERLEEAVEMGGQSVPCAARESTVSE